MEKNITPLLRNIFLIALGVFLFTISSAWIFSPYKDKVVSSVGIDIPCEIVYDYLGNADNASDWSSFIKFMETINEASVEDGAIGSKRNCYTGSEKTAFRWEEEVLENVKNEFRKVSCYNFEGFSLRAPVLEKEQIYLEKDYGCEVKFTLDFMFKPSLWDVAKMKFSAYQVKSVFDQDLANIKNEINKRRP